MKICEFRLVDGRGIGSDDPGADWRGGLSDSNEWLDEGIWLGMVGWHWTSFYLHSNV